jgi:hypothetical protein
MTRIKYATIGHTRATDNLSIIRGKKTGKIGYAPTDDEDSIFGNPIFSEQVVELPETMTPTEYSDYVDETVGQDADCPITRAMIEVAKKKGVDYQAWDWPVFTEANA